MFTHTSQEEAKPTGYRKYSYDPTNTDEVLKSRQHLQYSSHSKKPAEGSLSKMIAPKKLDFSDSSTRPRDNLIRKLSQMSTTSHGSERSSQFFSFPQDSSEAMNSKHKQSIDENVSEYFAEHSPEQNKFVRKKISVIQSNSPSKTNGQTLGLKALLMPQKPTAKQQKTENEQDVLLGKPRKRVERCEVSANPAKPNSMEIEFEMPAERMKETFEIFKYYENIKIIGKGQFSSVYRARRKDSGSDYAVKLINSNQFIQKKTFMKQRIEVEVNIFQNYLSEQHPNLLSLVEVFNEEDNCLIVMDLCEGNLTQLVSSLKAQFTLAMAIKIIEDAAKGLEFFHSKNLAHMDIKLENLLYYFDDQKNLRVKLADYGFVTASVRNKGDEVWEGDGNYMAPELLDDFQAYTSMDLKKCDIYSLGLSLTELFFCLEKKGKVRETNDFFCNYLENKQEFNAKLLQLLRRMINIDPEARPTIADIQEAVLEVELDQF